jgi:hypothetical protein
MYCHSVCSRTIIYCLDRGENQLAHLLGECMRLCKTTAGFLLLESGFQVRTCKDCADICALAAEECKKFTEDEQILFCSTVCKKTIEACNQITSASYAI